VVASRLGTAGAWAGAGVIATGAVLNAAGTLAPVIVVSLLEPACGPSAACEAASMSVLAVSLALDALFNLLLGVGLVLLGAATLRGRGPRWLAMSFVVAGLASVPVSLQIVSPLGADLLLVAGPLWLLVITAASVRLWRGEL
jgi:hypothetical protein